MRHEPPGNYTSLRTYHERRKNQPVTKRTNTKVAFGGPGNQQEFGEASITNSNSSQDPVVVARFPSQRHGALVTARLGVPSATQGVFPIVDGGPQFLQHDLQG